MGAPVGIVWGDIVGGYGRIGIYTKLSSTDTATTLTCEIWFWSKYSVSDSSNTMYWDVLNSTGSATTSHGKATIDTTVANGIEWSMYNQVKISSWGQSFTKTYSAATKYIYAKLADVDRVGGTMYASTTFTVPALPWYSVYYNAAGASNVPAAQKKWYGVDLTLSSTIPTRTGYLFKGWSSTFDNNIYKPGALYTRNGNATFYAEWEANKYTVSYNANGGTGAPSNQTKTHAVDLTLSSTVPKRTGYTFLGWAISSSATSAAYSPGSKYQANSNVILYAVWRQSYVIPIIHSFTVTRCDSNGTATDTGTCGLIKFDWRTTNAVTEITIAWESTAGSGSVSVSESGTSGTVSQIIGNNALSTEAAYTITVTVSDSGGRSNAKNTLSGAFFPIDFLGGGKGVAFGKPAEHEGVAEFALEGKFDKPVYGKALGMDRLPAIPSGSDLNNYMETGCYAVRSNAIAASCSNIPVDRAGRLEVWSATGEGVRLNQWSYLRQRYVPYNMANAVWEREITRSEDNVWRYYDWWKSSLTPDASEKVYHTQKLLWGGDLSSGMYMTAGHTANLTEAVSAQANGIVLVFCYYNGTTDTNWGFNSHFVPKQLIALQPGKSFYFSGDWNGAQWSKLLYIHDTSITGHNDNNLNGDGFYNARFVLRYVIGV